MDQKEVLIEFLTNRLIDYYQRDKRTGKSDDSETKYINGIMASIRILGFAENDELEEGIKAAHLDVFKTSYEDRKIAQALTDGGEHWEFFETPAIHRKHQYQLIPKARIEFFLAPELPHLIPNMEGTK